MKKAPLLNIALSRLIASLGHGEMLVIGDAGLPVPPGVDFVSTLRIVLSEMQVESHVLAEEILLKQPPALTYLEALESRGELGQRRLLSHDCSVTSNSRRSASRPRLLYAPASASRTATSSWWQA